MPALLKLPVETTQFSTRKKTPSIEFSWEMADENEYCSKEPPAWHAPIVEERHQAWMEGKIESQDIDVFFKELKAELGIE